MKDTSTKKLFSKRKGKNQSGQSPRISKAAVGRVLSGLIEYAATAAWSPERLGATISAVKGYISDQKYIVGEGVDMEAYQLCREEIDRSERRSRLARERWLNKKSADKEPHEVSADTATPFETLSNVEAEAVSDVTEAVKVVPPATKWGETKTLLEGKVELPKKRPVYPEDVPEQLRALGVESYVEYVRHRYYGMGLRGEELETRVWDSADYLARDRKREAGNY